MSKSEYACWGCKKEMTFETMPLCPDCKVKFGSRIDDAKTLLDLFKDDVRNDL